LGIGDWGLGPIPNPQSPIPNPQSPGKIIFLNLTFSNKTNNFLLINKFILKILKKLLKNV
jgi:hypothetical protein